MVKFGEKKIKGKECFSIIFPSNIYKSRNSSFHLELLERPMVMSPQSFLEGVCAGMILYHAVQRIFLKDSSAVCPGSRKPGDLFEWGWRQRQRGWKAIISTVVTTTMMEEHERLEESTGGVHVPTLLWCIKEGFLEERTSMWVLKKQQKWVMLGLHSKEGERIFKSRNSNR